MQLCIFSEKQTAESFGYRVHFWASVSLPQEKGREDRDVEWSLKRQTRVQQYLLRSVWVCVCSCVQAVCLLKKTFNRAFITPSMMQTDVLKHSMIQHCAFKPREGSRAILCVLSSRHQLGQNCNLMWEYFNQLILNELC